MLVARNQGQRSGEAQPARFGLTTPPPNDVPEPGRGSSMKLARGLGRSAAGAAAQTWLFPLIVPICWTRHRGRAASEFGGRSFPMRRHSEKKCQIVEGLPLQEDLGPERPLTRGVLMALTRQARAAEYRANASDSAATAASCALERVRELHELAAYRWTQLAELEDRSTVNLARRFGRAARAAATAPTTVPEEAATCTV